MTVDAEPINVELRRRQGGYGRGGRQRIETDAVDILQRRLEGRHARQPDRAARSPTATTSSSGSTICRGRGRGMRDLTGAMKYLGLDPRRARTGQCARDGGPRGGRGAGQAVARASSASRRSATSSSWAASGSSRSMRRSIELRAIRDESEVYGLNLERDEAIKQLIDAAGKDGDTLGGIVEVRVDGLPFGLGTHAQWDRKLDGRLAQAVMAVQAIKGVEIGLGFEAARRRGSQVHDPIQYDESQRDTPNLGFVRPTNNAGGLEAGMTNGQPLVIRAAKKPISTLRPAAGIDQSRHEAEAGSQLRAERRLRGAGGERDRRKRGGVRSRLRAGRQIRRRQPGGNEGALRAVSSHGPREIGGAGVSEAGLECGDYFAGRRRRSEAAASIPAASSVKVAGSGIIIDGK